MWTLSVIQSANSREFSRPYKVTAEQGGGRLSWRTLLAARCARTGACDLDAISTFMCLGFYQTVPVLDFNSPLLNPRTSQVCVHARQEDHRRTQISRNGPTWPRGSAAISAAMQKVEKAKSSPTYDKINRYFWGVKIPPTPI